MHEVVTVEAARDSQMCGTFHYWGPMLIQARLEFSDGSAQEAHVYARMPGTVGL
jgi:hypothetical protein